MDPGQPGRPGRTLPPRLPQPQGGQPHGQLRCASRLQGRKDGVTHPPWRWRWPPLEVSGIQRCRGTLLAHSPPRGAGTPPPALRTSGCRYNCRSVLQCQEFARCGFPAEALSHIAKVYLGNGKGGGRVSDVPHQWSKRMTVLNGDVTGVFVYCGG